MNAAPNMALETRFIPFASILGTLEWSCAHCGCVQRSKLSRQQYVITCRECKCSFEHGSVFRPPVPRRSGVKPRDIQMDLAPLRRALTRPRRLSDRGCVNVELDNHVDQVVNSDHAADHADAGDPDR